MVCWVITTVSLAITALKSIIALIIVAAIFGNGNFGFGGWGNNGANGANVIASTAEREMLLSAIQRNGVDLSQLLHLLTVQ